MSSKQLSEWMAYEELEGHLDLGVRVDTAAAAIQATYANINRDKKKKSSPYKLREFLPRWGRRRRQTPEQMMQQLRRSFGGQ